MERTQILVPLALTALSASLPVTGVAQPADVGVSSPEVLPAVYSAGTVMVRVGASYIEPDDDTGKWRFNRNVYPFLDGLRYDIDSETTWNVTAGFMPIDHFSVEVGYIGNSEHDVDLFGLQSPFERDRIKAGDIERRTGLLMFNWFPVCIESWVQPYVGIGGHYTDFDNVRFSFDANDYFALVSDGIGQARLFVEDTWGWAGQLGVDVMFGRDSNWLVNVAVQYLDVEFDADLHFTVPSEIDPRLFVNAARTDVEFDPWIYNLGIGYKF